MEGAVEEDGATDAEGADEIVGATEKEGSRVAVGTLDGVSEASNTVGCIEILGDADWVGAIDADGRMDGTSDGLVETDPVVDGAILGWLAVGFADGGWEAWFSVGLVEGRREGDIDWIPVGPAEGPRDGSIGCVPVGLADAAVDGFAEGPTDGPMEGSIVWIELGLTDGGDVCIIGLEVRAADGVTDGESVVDATGVEVGIDGESFLLGAALGLADGNAGTERDADGGIDGASSSFGMGAELGKFVVLGIVGELLGCSAVGVEEGTLISAADTLGPMEGESVATPSFDVGNMDGASESDGAFDIVGAGDGIALVDGAALVVGEIGAGVGTVESVGYHDLDDLDDLESEDVEEEGVFFEALGILYFLPLLELLDLDFLDFFWRRRWRSCCELSSQSSVGAPSMIAIPLPFRSNVLELLTGSLSFE
jgi:hypothetical protein